MYSHKTHWVLYHLSAYFSMLLANSPYPIACRYHVQSLHGGAHMINDLGQRLQEQRILRNLSQKQVASSIGVSASVISNYESGERTPSVEILISLAHLYHCSADYLLGIDKSNTVKLLDVSMLNDKQYQLLQSFLLSLQE